jgi:release factor glutamine methyltransferase
VSTAVSEARGDEPKRVWTVLELLRWTQGYFERQGIDSARLDAECLLAHALGLERLRLYVDFDQPVEPAERARFRELVKRRAVERVPVSHLLGSREFWSMPLRVTPDVLTPRPETETLVTAALDRFPNANASFTVLDLGTGSGAVALAVARERPESVLTATDSSQKALSIAQENAEALGMSGRIRFLLGDWLEPVNGEKFDLMLANPPYVADRERDRLPPELSHEPEQALFAGADGLDALRVLVEEGPRALRPGGAIALELAPPQANWVAKALEGSGLVDVATHRDLAGRPRVVSGLRSNN